MMKVIVGRTYRAKKPAHANGFVNDRTVLYVGEMGTVQYDGPSVANGRHYPKTTVDAFEKWAAEDVTDSLADRDYQSWPEYLASKRHVGVTHD